MAFDSLMRYKSRARVQLAADPDQHDPQALRATIGELLDELDALEAQGAFGGDTFTPAARESVQSMHESEARYRTLVEMSPDGIGLFTPSGVIRYANRQLAAMFGAASPAELEERSVFALVPPEALDQARANFTQLFAAGSSSREMLLRRLDGSGFYCELSSAAIRDERGVVVAFISQARDITRRIQAREAILAERQHFLALFENSPVATWLEDFRPVGQWMDGLRQSGVRDLRAYLAEHPGEASAALSQIKILSMNQAAVILSGATSKDDLLVNLDRLYSHVNESALIEEVETFWNGGSHFEFEIEHERLDGRPQHLITRIDIPQQGEVADLSRVIVTSIDITDRVVAARALEASERRFQLAMEASQEGLWEWDMLRNQATYSSAYFDILGRERAESYTTTGAPFWLAWVHPDDYGRVMEAVAACMTGRSDTFDLEFRMQHQDGGWRWILSRGKVLARSPDGRQIHAIGTNMEITASKEADQILRSRTAELETLFTISTALSATHSAAETMTVVLAELRRVLSTDASHVSLLDPGSQQFTIAHADGLLSSLAGWQFAAINSISGRVVATGQPILIEDLGLEQTPFTGIAAPGLGPAAFVPLIAGTESLGVIAVERLRDMPQFTAAELRLLTAIGEMLGSNLQRAQLSDHALRRLSRLQSLHQIDRAIATSLGLDLTLNVVLAEVLTQLNGDIADILLLNRETDMLEYAAGRGFRSDPRPWNTLRVGAGVAGRVTAQREIVRVPLDAEGHTFLRKEMINLEGALVYHGAPMIAKGQVIGVLEVLHRTPFVSTPEWREFFEAVATQAAIAIDNGQLFAGLQRANRDLSAAYDATIEGWSRALDLRDKETEGHSERVTDLTLLLARELGVSDEELTHIRRGALLHDIGKMGIPDQILLKPGKLTDEEWGVMRRHPGYARHLLSPIIYLLPALDIPYCHHEKWDGSGYPRGLAGEEIPLTARIFAVVDVWDALTNDRLYRPAWSVERTIDYIRSERGRHFDPAVVDAFLALID